MGKTLLIGNGLNRTINDIAWGNLLEKIASVFGVEYNPNISMPLEFERIVNARMKKIFDSPTVNSTISSAKEMVANEIKKLTLPPEAIHRNLPKLNVNNVITTNYDYMLEYAFDDGYIDNNEKRKKYLFEKTCTINETDFYHIHGVCQNTNSMCLGYEHYMGLVEHLRADLNTKKDKKPTEMTIKKILYGEDSPKNTWGEKFYTSDIAIVGLELSDAEADLWWLITHRAFLYYSDYCHLRQSEKLDNRIVFYDVIDMRESGTDEEKRYRDKKATEKKVRHQLLKDEHVEVKVYELGKKYTSYPEAYEQIIEDIRSDL